MDYVFQGGLSHFFGHPGVWVTRSWLYFENTTWNYRRRLIDFYQISAIVQSFIFLRFFVDNHELCMFVCIDHLEISLFMLPTSLKFFLVCLLCTTNLPTLMFWPKVHIPYSIFDIKIPWSIFCHFDFRKFHVRPQTCLYDHMDSLEYKSDTW